MEVIAAYVPRDIDDVPRDSVLKSSDDVFVTSFGTAAELTSIYPFWSQYLIVNYYREWIIIQCNFPYLMSSSSLFDVVFLAQPRV